MWTKKITANVKKKIELPEERGWNFSLQYHYYWLQKMPWIRLRLIVFRRRRRRNYRSLTMIAKLTFQRESLCPTLTTVMSSCLHFKYNLVSEATSKALVASSRTEKRVTRRNCYNFALFTPTVSSLLVSFISHYLHREISIVTTHGYGIKLLQYR